MPQMDSSTLKALLAAERSAALSAMQANKLSAERDSAMAYYTGDMSDMRAPEGRSQAVSTDVSDTIESLMPALMDIFCSSDEVVQFVAVGKEDEQAAQQETDYVNHVFMQKNPGFLVLYSFIKDALLSKNGIVKCWWEDEERETSETYYDLTDEQFMMLVANPTVEIVEHTEKDRPTYGEDDTDADEDDAAESEGGAENASEGGAQSGGY